jgi:Reverse transcriptase (RNA-dependent DNA polymerase)
MISALENVYEEHTKRRAKIKNNVVDTTKEFHYKQLHVQENQTISTRISINKMSFYKQLNDKYGEYITKLFKQLDTKHSKLAGLINRKNFLLNCRRWHVLPKSLRFNFGSLGQDINQQKFQQMTEKFLFSLMNEKICIIFRDISTLKSEINSLIEKISVFPIPITDLTSYLDKIKADYEKNFEKRKSECLKKFEKLKNDLVFPIVSGNNVLKSKAPRIVSDSHDKKHLVNLTNVELPVVVENILSLGPKFNMPTCKNKTPYDEIVADIETGLCSIEDETQRNIMRSGVSNILQNHKKSTNIKDSSQDKVLKLHFNETKKFLKENQDIILTKADKGNISVLMNQSDYDMKMSNLLAEDDTYEIIRRHSTETLQRKINALIETWRTKEYINDSVSKKLKSYNSTISKIYGLPKIHKNEIPLRPIVCSINAPTYNLSKYYCSILNNVIGKTSSFIKDSVQLKEFLSNKIIPPNHVFISLDVKSLFTNVDSNLVIDSVTQRWRTISKYTNLPLQNFIDGLNMILDNCFFTYKNVVYHQVFGTPMGSPVSPVVANLVMENFESEILDSLDFEPIFYKRYVDDIILCIPKEKQDYIFNVFNSKHPRLQFTIEKEENASIPFLELLLIREANGRITTDWYHKETWSGRYLNFNSKLPISYKRNTVTLLSNKILQLSENKFHEKNFNLLQSTLIQNSYPTSFFKNLIRSERQKFQGTDLSIIANHNQIDPDTNDTSKFYLSIPFIDNLFYKIKTYLQKFNVNVVGKSSNDLYKSLFSKLKDEVPKPVKSSVVYKVNCQDCDLIYIGNTMQYLKTRIGQHKTAVKNKNKDHSALAEHAIDSKHNIDWLNYNVVKTENKLKTRQFLEMINIKKFKDKCMNRQIESQDLTNVYDSLFFT